MSQRWWLVGVAGVGVVLAVLLVPRPDTGADIPEANPENTRPLDFKQDPVAAPTPAPAPTRRAKAEEAPKVGLKRGPMPERVAPENANLSPEQKEWIERRNAKDPTAARAMGGPMGELRRQLYLDGSDEAKALIAKIAPVQAEMNDLGQNPDPSADLAGVVSRMDSVMDDVKSSKWYSDPIVKAQVARYESARDAWQAE